MTRISLAGASALLLAPAAVIGGTLIQPTLSDDAGSQVAALTDHRQAMIAGIALSTAAAVLMIAGVVWLAHALAPRAERLASAGGILGAAGFLVIVFESGITAAAPAIAAGGSPAAAVEALHRVGASAAVTVLEPLSLIGDAGLALLAVAALRAGAPRWSAAAVTLGAFAGSAGFASETRALVVAGFAVLLAGLLRIVRDVVAEPHRALATVVQPG
jgi:hypothetical protein